MTDLAKEKNKRTGVRLRAAMKKRGITGNGMANAAQLHFTQISRILNGHSELTPENAEKFAAILDCDPGWLLLGDGAGPHQDAKNAPQSDPEAEAAALAVQVVRERPEKAERLLGLLRGLLLGAAICCAPAMVEAKPMARCTPETQPDSLHNLSTHKRQRRKAA